MSASLLRSSLSLLATLLGVLVIVVAAATDDESSSSPSAHYEGRKPVVIEQEEVKYRFKPRPYAVSLDLSDLFTGLLQGPQVIGQPPPQAQQPAAAPQQQQQQNGILPGGFSIPGLPNFQLPAGLIPGLGGVPTTPQQTQTPATDGGEASKTPGDDKVSHVEAATPKPFIEPPTKPVKPFDLGIPSTRDSSRGNEYDVTTVDLCYVIGSDFEKGHVPWNERWADRRVYFHELTQLAEGHMNKFQGDISKHFPHYFKLNNAGTYDRSDFDAAFPENAKKDTHNLRDYKCDLAVFLVFNDFTSGEWTTGVKYSGVQSGGPCMANNGDGFVVVVDQGFTVENPKDFWIGPQILAHFLLRSMMDDLYKPDAGRYPWTADRTEGYDFRCPSERSILHEYIRAGDQYRDECSDAQLYWSGITCRAPCIETNQFVDGRQTGKSYPDKCPKIGVDPVPRTAGGVGYNNV